MSQSSLSPEIRFAGNAGRLHQCRDKIVLYDGARGTGKTMPASWKWVLYCLQNPGSRGLVIRKTRASMSQTTLVTLESVLAQACPEALTGCSREHVHRYGVGDSEIVVSGIDLESRQRSGEYSWIWIDEANEVTREDIESLLGCLRWPVKDYYQMCLTTNPDSDEHPLWKMFKEGKLTRIQSKHEDNPFVTEDYMNTLRLLTGVRKKRFLEGIWTAAEGQVLDQWDKDYNLIDCPEDKDGLPDYDALHVSWYFASVDWGLRVAGCMCIWGVCLDGSILLVKECYYSQKTGGWWCDRLCELDKVFHLRAIVCDPSDPAAIMDFNTRLGYPTEGPQAIAWGATNKRGTMNMSDRAGLWQLCEMVAQKKLRVLRDCAHSGVDADGVAFGPIDPHLREAGLPTCSVEEVSGYVWMRDKNGHYIKDVTDPKVPDHGMDAWRYACMFARDRDMSDPPMIPKDDPESYGALYHHNALVAALKVAEEEGVPFDDVYAEYLEEQQNG